MTRTIIPALLAAALLAPLGAGAETILALRDRDQPDLISFDSADPATLTGRLAISGLPTLPVRARPVAVEFRAGGGVYLLVNNLPGANDCAVYLLSTTSGQASPLGSSTFSCGPAGDPDMDPRVDYLRIVNGTQNYRYNLTTYSKTTPVAVAFKTGDVHEGATPDIRAVAYDQNVSGTASTSLFALDAASASLVRVGDVNATVGNQDAGELSTIGPLGVSFTSAAFDVSGATGTAFVFLRDAAATPANRGLYTVNLGTGAATFVGPVGDGSATILSLTAVPATLFLPPPPPHAGVDLEGGAWPLSGLGLLALLGLRRRRA